MKSVAAADAQVRTVRHLLAGPGRHRGRGRSYQTNSSGSALICLNGPPPGAGTVPVGAATCTASDRPPLSHNAGSHGGSMHRPRKPPEGKFFGAYSAQLPDLKALRPPGSGRPDRAFMHPGWS